MTGAHVHVAVGLCAESAVKVSRALGLWSLEMRLFWARALGFCGEEMRLLWAGSRAPTSLEAKAIYSMGAVALASQHTSAYVSIRQAYGFSFLALGLEQSIAWVPLL
jgi:hypothetical protein